MKINGNLEVLGEATLRLAEESTVSFAQEDKGKIWISPSGTININSGDSIETLLTSTDKSTLTGALGVMVDAWSFNPSAFQTFSTVTGLDGNSSVFDVLIQLDAAIPKTFVASYPTISAQHIINHDLGVDIAHVSVKDNTSGNRVKDSEMTITFTDNDTITINLTQQRSIKVLVTTV